TPRGVEMKSCDPTMSCRRLTCRLTVGWLVLVISAARLNDLVLATARKTRSSPQNCPLRSVSSSSGLLLKDCCSSSNGSMSGPAKWVAHLVQLSRVLRKKSNPACIKLRVRPAPAIWTRTGCDDQTPLAQQESPR